MSNRPDSTTAEDRWVGARARPQRIQYEFAYSDQTSSVLTQIAQAIGQPVQLPVSG